MHKNTLMERGLSHVLILALVALMGLGAAVATTLKADAVLGTTIDVTGVDYDGNLDVPNLPEVNDPSDIAGGAATANFSPNGEAETVTYGINNIGNINNIDRVAATLAGSGLLHRTNAVGGIVDFLIDLNMPGTADDIVNIAVTLGGINAIGGPATLLVLDDDGLDGSPGDNGLAAFSLFAQNIRGQASVTVTSGALTGVSVGAPVAEGLPKAHFVGAATAGAFVDTFFGTVDAHGTHNPKTFVAGTANAFDAAGSNFWFVNFHDAGGFNVLNGQLVSIALSVTVGAASIPAFASVPRGQPALANVVTDDELGIAPLEGAERDRGSVGFGLTTAASTPSNGTITVTLGTVVLTRAFTATGAAVDLVSATAPGAAILSVAGGTNPGPSLWAIVIADSAGNGLAAFRPAVVTPTVDVAGQLDFKDLDLVAGTWNLGITPAATAVPGTYTVTLTLATGLVTNDTITFEVVIGGATTTLTHTITDAAGTDITAAPRVGIGEFITIVLTATDANGNPPPNATIVGGAGPNLGLVRMPVAPATNTAGTSTVVYVAPAATGIVTFNYLIGAVNDTFTVEVGGVGGQLIDGLAADGDTVIDANVGDQVSLTVIATLLGVNTPDAIIRWEATSGSPTPSEGSTGTDGGHTTVVTSTVTGTVTVTATAVSEGVNDKVPVPGVESVTFTISFGSSTVVFTTGAQATYQSWESADADSSVFENVAGLVAVWIYDGTNWLIYASDPDAPNNLKMAFVVTSGPPRSILFVVSTGPVTLTLN